MSEKKRDSADTLVTFAVGYLVVGPVLMTLLYGIYLILRAYS